MIVIMISVSQGDFEIALDMAEKVYAWVKMEL